MMQPYTFFSWDQIEQWIRDNGLVKWDFAATNRQKIEDGSRVNDVVANSEWYEGDLDFKLKMTQKQLSMQPGRYLYGRGYHSANGSQGAASCEICLGGMVTLPGMQQPVAGFQQMPQAAPMTQSEKDQLKAEIRKEVETEWEKRRLEEERNRFEEERKNFEADKSGVIGMLVNYLAPAAKAVMGQSRIAGLDLPHTPLPIEQTPSEQAAPSKEASAEDPFTVEEAQKLEELLIRFKKVEPEYMVLLEKVVTMAESGDPTYSMAKQFLCK